MSKLSIHKFREMLRCLLRMTFVLKKERKKNQSRIIHVCQNKKENNICSYFQKKWHIPSSGEPALPQLQLPSADTLSAAHFSLLNILQIRVGSEKSAEFLLPLNAHQRLIITLLIRVTWLLTRCAVMTVTTTPPRSLICQACGSQNISTRGSDATHDTAAGHQDSLGLQFYYLTLFY